MPAASYLQSDTHATKPFEKVHSDIKEFPVISYHRYRYIITFLDDFTSHLWVFFLKQKSEALDRLQDFIVFVQTQYNTTVKTVMSDYGGEYKSLELGKYLWENGIQTMSSVLR